MISVFLVFSIGQRVGDRQASGAGRLSGAARANGGAPQGRLLLPA
ncbi:hypothetical protein [Accumulibacter sp.]|nr:hypothetical protein [Accumulibacter sp.]HRE71905.1 hypothetical protein [Accumulibacter sp.]